MANKKAKKGLGKKASSRASTPASEAPIAEFDQSASGTTTRSGRKISVTPHLRMDGVRKMTKEWLEWPQVFRL